MDIKQARKNVIEQQIRPWGGLNVRANQALSEIPREKFVPDDSWSSDHTVPEGWLQKKVQRGQNQTSQSLLSPAGSRP